MNKFKIGNRPYYPWLLFGLKWIYYLFRGERGISQYRRGLFPLGAGFIISADLCGPCGHFDGGSFIPGLLARGKEGGAGEDDPV